MAAAVGVSLPFLLERIGFDPAFSTSAVTAATDAFAYGTVLAVTTYLFA
jgi:Mg/Co/Ni transporter MgtE